METVQQDSSQWSVVPYSTAPVKPIFMEESSLTWWRDPEDPSERKALIDLPIGLRPPSYNFAYSAILVLSLFHVSAFQQAVLSYRPTPYSWGSPRNYWKGFGDTISAYTFKRTVKEDAEDIDEKIAIQDINPQLTSDTEYDEFMQNEVHSLPKCVQAMAELQKLFAFLGNTKRLYGNVSHYVRALNTRLSSTGWESVDKRFEVFLEMVIGSLIDCDDQSEDIFTTAPVFRNFFELKARIESDDDYEEQVYHLTLNTDRYLNSFHECLDPLVFECVDSTYKFTSFSVIPPIMMIVLENKSGFTHTGYKVDPVIYMDRYMTENKPITVERFKKMDYSRKQIERAKLNIKKLTENNHPMLKDKRQLLEETMRYFSLKSGEDTVRSVLGSVRKSMDARVAELEAEIREHQECIHTVFDTDDMKKLPYLLSASFHHDGKSGTGHYWAYIWVEDAEGRGCWYKFCDASVQAASVNDLYNDPVSPFALMYVDQQLPSYDKQTLFEAIPDDLKKFIAEDNNDLEQEIRNYEQRHDDSLATTPDHSLDFIDKIDESHFDDKETSSLIFDDNTSTGTIVGQNNEFNDPPYAFTGQGFDTLKERVATKMREVAAYAPDDYRFIQKFENFLARSQNEILLEHLYLYYSSDMADKENINDTLVDEFASKDNDEFTALWKQYDTYIDIADMVTRALFNYSEKHYQVALQLLLEAKRREASWKTHLIINPGLYTAYAGLETLTFNRLIQTYGKECLKILNQAAYNEASKAAYRTRGLEEAIRIAYQAQSIIGPDSVNDDDYLKRLWLNFTDQKEVESLTPTQEALLNTLVMIYIEKQTDASTDAQPIIDKDPSSYDLLLQMPLWQKYHEICSDCQQLVANVS